MSAKAFAYHEPSPLTLLILSSFILLLNCLSFILNTLLHCGLIAQIFVGVAYGTPGLQWLSTEIQSTVVDLGYIGLILLVYEGGLATDFRSLRSNAGISVAVALTGVAVPIALSFSLMGLINATPLQAFAAGAALCSTSLGTTFSVLQSSGLEKTRLGVVLATAAMLDDVVGLVMVKVIVDVGDGDVEAGTVLRPIGVSFAFLVFVIVVARYGLKPLAQRNREGRILLVTTKMGKIARSLPVAFGLHTIPLIGMVTAASYAGTSNLYSAYLTGALIAWYDDELCIPQAPEDQSKSSLPTGSSHYWGNMNIKAQEKAENAEQIVVSEGCGRRPLPSSAGNQNITNDTDPRPSISFPNGRLVFDRYYHPVLEVLLKPFFFASIGFAIPITQMFAGPIVWKGLVYTGLMFLGKFVTGVWLLRLGGPRVARLTRLLRALPKYFRASICMASFAPTPDDHNDNQAQRVKSNVKTIPGENTTPIMQQNETPKANKPLSLYPSSIIGLAMVARGEIGYLIASLAESTGVFRQHDQGDSSSQIYLIVVWAITLCTIIGPISVGVLVRRVKKLQQAREINGESGDPLGSWSVI